MNNSRKKPIIGILGGIGCGKSAVAAELGKLGCKVIDADAIAHELLRRPDVLAAVVDLFGGEILDCDGQIDRTKLGKIVFSDSEQLSSLISIIHPEVLERTEQLIGQYKNERDVHAIVLDMPLLVEVGWEKRCDNLIFIECDRAKRLERLRKNADFDENQVTIREKFQISLDNKARIAENSIDNNSGFSILVKQVVEVFNKIINNI